MKKIFFYLTIVIVLLVAISGKGICQSQMTMTTAPKTQEVKILLSGSGRANIDWGDGSIDKIANINSFPEASHSEYSHNYSDTFSHIIILTGTNIRGIICDENHLTSLNISKYKPLRVLVCCNNNLKELDISKNTKLMSLSCGGNHSTELNISKNTKLTSLECSRNNLMYLDVSENLKLKYLECNNNQLTHLDLFLQVELYGLRCAYNNFSEIVLNEIFSSLNDRKVEYSKKESRSRRCNIKTGKFIYIEGNPGVQSCDRSIAEKKEWRFITW